MVSCSKIGNQGNNGDKAAIVDGTSYNLTKGYWGYEYDEASLYFTNMDLFNMTTIPERVEMLTVNIDGKATNIQAGTHKGYMEFWSMNPSTEQYYTATYGNVTVIIAQDGSNYTVTIPEIIVESYEGDIYDKDNVKKVPFSFRYTGPLERYAF